MQVGIRAWSDNAKFVGSCQLCGHDRKVVVAQAEQGMVVQVRLCGKCITIMAKASRTNTAERRGML